MRRLARTEQTSYYYGVALSLDCWIVLPCSFGAPLSACKLVSKPALSPIHISHRTGNTIYLGLGLVAPSEGIRWIKALTSISFFCFGSFFFSRFHRYLTPGKRWVLIASYTIQALCIVLAALIVTLGHDTTDDLNWQVLVPLASVAFQSSGQAVTSRVLKYNGLTSVVLTSNYCDLFSDPKILALSNAERNRRVAAPLLVLLGAMMGGLFAHSSFGLKGALWTAAVLKSIAVVKWVFWRADPDDV
jgi:uncharacterized membrane protein YoaK (UPF0700 family)